MFRQKIPTRIGRLDELANNLWWSWHERARALFQALDSRLWELTGYNPVKQLRDINPDKLRAAASDPAFLNLYDSAMSAFDADILASDTWSATRYGLPPGPVAYFSAEFAIHSCLPIYAGGLGILAGDLCKEASDSGLPLVGVGFMYPEGYFQQRISAEGWQQEVYHRLDFDEAPIQPWPLPPPSGPWLKVQVGDKSLCIGAWRVCIGRVNLCLLDTNVAANSPEDRQLSARLYTADQEQRIQQEIILGIGGVQMLRALGIKPAVWHANEGHTAFMMLERIREEVEGGVTFAEALRRVRATTVFTTHTPVPAGSDVFPVGLVEKYFHHYWEVRAIDRETFLRLGQQDGGDEPFNMTVLGLKTAEHCNGVSQLHGGVARKMWRGLWPGTEEDKVPISHITNGVHVSSWIAPELYELYRKYLGPVWIKRHFDPEVLQYVADIPDDELWASRQILRRKLIRIILNRAQERWARGEVTSQQVLAMGALLDVDVLTIAFVRRFAEYKRPALIFQDIERLKKIINDPWRPVQIVFAGKSHPADTASKGLLQQVYRLAADREFQGRIAFVEDYDMHLARYLVQGADVWLNAPRRLQEACGTSGMKAAINGVPHFSVRDGWWHEGYNGANGWAIGDSLGMTPGEQDNTDAETIYRLLEREIVPLFYDRDTRDVPRDWIRVVKESIKSVIPAFCARRMLREYIERMYVPALQSAKKQESH